MYICRAQNNNEVVKKDSASNSEGVAGGQGTANKLQAAIDLVKEASSEYADCGEDHDSLMALLSVIRQRAALQ